jgi:hypothetical protein
MKYNIADIFEWIHYAREVSIVTHVYRDWDGEIKYILESYSKNGIPVYTKEHYRETDLIKLIEDKIARYYPVIK